MVPKQNDLARAGWGLLFDFFENNSFAEFFGVFFKLNFALHFLFILARPINLAGFLVLYLYKLVLTHLYENYAK